MGPQADEFRFERYAGVGCVTAVAGFFGGGMIAVMAAKIVGWFSMCTPQTGLPACNWHRFMIVGSLLGLVTLPGVALWKLSRRA